MDDQSLTRRHHMAPDHVRRTARVLLETGGVLTGLGLATVASVRAEMFVLAGLFGILQGVWAQRLYVVGHEAAHGKLLPAQPALNDLFGQLALLPILVPLPVFRKIHRFHHGCNRRDPATSALDVFVVRNDGPVQRLWAWTVWLAAVLAGGWFWHSVVSIVLFLALPVRIAERISPAFRGWTFADRARSIGVFTIALAAHFGLAVVGGAALWGWVAAWPLVVFGWVYSVQLYVYHYATTIGPEVTLHARRLRDPGVGWWLLNLNEHDTHHRNPRVVWYALPEAGEPLPAGFEGNQVHDGFFRGVLDQLRGPTFVIDE